MGVKAQWHTADIQTADGDPFADEAVTIPVVVQAVGLPISLDQPYAQLEVRLAELMEEEGRLLAEGQSCAIRNDRHSSCFACPVYEGGLDTPKGSLCRLGRETERVVTTLVARRVGA